MKKLAQICVFILGMAVLIPLIGGVCLIAGIIDIKNGDSPFDEWSNTRYFIRSLSELQI